ncbi:MAG TPA: zinc-dependent metalloprotease family protein [Cytophagaceae bacterium]|jgi:archaemetzincin|nr:zinc-dependent metalloprotease family protein [Cytophagaceae bacterium]
MKYLIILISIYLVCISCKKSEPKICLRPFSGISKKEVIEVKKSLEAYYHYPVTILKKQALPKSALYEPFNRYMADSLLIYLKLGKPHEFDKIIGLTDYDISTNKNNNPHYGIFGLAFIGGESCVVSSFRLNKLSTLFDMRLSKLAVHEIGHTLGLDHCASSEKCFMTSAKGKLKNIDQEELKLCDNCREIIGLKQ